MISPAAVTLISASVLGVVSAAAATVPVAPAAAMLAAIKNAMSFVRVVFFMIVLSFIIRYG